MRIEKISGLCRGLILAASALLTACGDSSSGAGRGGASEAAWAYLNPSVNYGQMTDARDGRIYKTVVIGTQTWMAQNLNYADSVAMPNLAGNFWCYENSADSCAKYGRLYTWTGAMNITDSYRSVSTKAAIPSPHQGVCPSGWHIPTNADWTMLEIVVGGLTTAGTMLKSTIGWRDAGNGMDPYGFSALPAGYRHDDQHFSNTSTSAHFWSATETDTDFAYNLYLYGDYVGMIAYDYYEGNAFSVRCVKD